MDKSKLPCFYWPTLYIKLRSFNAHSGYVIQVNGTACAVPRLIIAILENYQQSVSMSLALINKRICEKYMFYWCIDVDKFFRFMYQDAKLFEHPS